MRTSGYEPNVASWASPSEAFMPAKVAREKKEQRKRRRNTIRERIKAREADAARARRAAELQRLPVGGTLDAQLLRESRTR